MIILHFWGRCSVEILILYHSGVGNTKQVAKWMKKYLEEKSVIELYSIEYLPKQIEYEKYDGVIMGFPTIHTHPTKQMINFMERIEKINRPMPTFVFTTCGLYSANTVRIFCKKCVEKNFIPVQGSSYRCKAVDGMLLTPKIKIFLTYEKDIEARIAKECNQFMNTLTAKNVVARIPRFKLYSIINFPNKLMGHLITFPIYTHKDNCIKCGRCIAHCPVQTMKVNQEGYPAFDKRKCVKCYRCIHHCPKYALSLNKRKPPKVLWKAN